MSAGKRTKLSLFEPSTLAGDAPTSGKTGGK
jgi:hypothetical protein